MDQGGPDGVPDAEAPPGAAQITFADPANVAPELVQRVEALTGNEAVGEDV
jgi:hypothetical protein